MDIKLMKLMLENQLIIMQTIQDMVSIDYGTAKYAMLEKQIKKTQKRVNRWDE